MSLSSWPFCCLQLDGVSATLKFSLNTSAELQNTLSSLFKSPKVYSIRGYTEILFR